VYEVNVSNSGGFDFSVKSDGYEFKIGPGSDAISPPATLLASLASCVGVYVRKYLDGAKLQIADFTVHAEAGFTSENPICFKDIRIHIDFNGKLADTKRQDGLLRFIENCPVHNTLKATPAVKVKLS